MNVDCVSVCLSWTGTIFVFCTRNPLPTVTWNYAWAQQLYSYTQQRRLSQDTETLKATNTPTAGQSSSDGDILSLRSHRPACMQEVTAAYLLCFIRIGHFNPTQNIAPETCRSQACFSTFHACKDIFFHAWNTNRYPCTSLLKHARFRQICLKHTWNRYEFGTLYR